VRGEIFDNVLREIFVVFRHKDRQCCPFELAHLMVIVVVVVVVVASKRPVNGLSEALRNHVVAAAVVALIAPIHAAAATLAFAVFALAFAAYVAATASAAAAPGILAVRWLLQRLAVGASGAAAAAVVVRIVVVIFFGFVEVDKVFAVVRYFLGGAPPAGGSSRR